MSPREGESTAACYPTGRELRSCSGSNSHGRPRTRRSFPAMATQDCSPKRELIVELLHDGCEKLGGEQPLADYLGVPMETLRMWLRGDGRPSPHIFLKCLDLFVDDRP